MHRVEVCLVICLLLALVMGCQQSEDGPQAIANPQNASSAVALAEKSDADVVKEKTFDDIKFDIEKDAPFERDMLTEDIEALFGKKIRIRGYMLPSFRKRGIKGFVLVRDNQECCFGPGAALFDNITVSLTDGQTTEYARQPIAVEGELSFQELKDHTGITRSIFHVEAERIE